MRVSALLVAALAIALIPAAFGQACSPRVPNGGFQQLMRTGEVINGPFALGTLLDKNMKPLLVNGAPEISHNPDFTSLHKVGNELYAITQTGKF
jgi:hypothetical protein